MRATCGQGFADALGRGYPEDSGPNMAIRNQDAYKWQAMQGTQVQPLVREDPTCCGATRPASRNSWNPRLLSGKVGFYSTWKKSQVKLRGKERGERGALKERAHGGGGIPSAAGRSSRGGEARRCYTLVSWQLCGPLPQLRS